MTSARVLVSVESTEFLNPQKPAMFAENSASDCLENSWEMKLIAQPIKWLENQ